MFVSVLISGLVSAFAYLFTIKLIPNLKEMFLKADIAGIDMNKRSKQKM